MIKLQKKFLPNNVKWLLTKKTTAKQIFTKPK